jgi:predicted DNA-binding transcriptional regulator YafY
VQPLRLANYGRRWYLIAWDTGRGDWRSFRVDRIDGRPATGAMFAPRPVPPDVAARLERGIAYAPFACRITLRLQGSVAELQDVLPVYCGVLEAETPTHSLLRMGAESAEGLLAQVLMIGRDVELVEGDAMLPALGRQLERIRSVFARHPGSVGH